MWMRNRFSIFLFGSILISFFFFPFLQSSYGIDHHEVAELEEFLIDFSKKMEGHRLIIGSLPPDLNAEKFFSILESYYPDSEIIKKARRYPIRVYPESESYVLILCDKDSEYILYKDFGWTITVIDFPYWRDRKRVPCEK